MPGISASTTWDVLLAAVLLGIVGGILRPVIVAAAVRLGWAGVFVGFLFSHALLGYFVLSVTPGITVDDFWSAFWASWIFAVLVSIGLWFVTAGDHSAVVNRLLRATRDVARTVTTTDQPGVVFIQIDGLSAPLLQWAVQAGKPADPIPMDPIGQPHDDRMARAAARDDARQPGRTSARSQRPGAGLPLV